MISVGYGEAVRKHFYLKVKPKARAIKVINENNC